MSLRRSPFIAFAFLPSFALACSGAPDDASESVDEPSLTDDAIGDDAIGETQAALTAVSVPFLYGHAAGMTTGNGYLTDPPLDGFLGWVGAYSGGSQSNALAAMTAGSAKATLSWKVYTATRSGYHKVATPESYVVTGSIRGAGTVSVELELFVGGTLTKRTYPVATTPGTFYLPFSQQVFVGKSFTVNAAKNDLIQYRASLVIAPNGLASTISIKEFGTPSIGNPNTNTPISITPPATIVRAVGPVPMQRSSI